MYLLMDNKLISQLIIMYKCEIFSGSSFQI